jgi:hypothetical protein
LTNPGQIVQLDGSAKLPAVDGSQLTNLPGGGRVVSDITTGAVFGSITAFADNGSGGTTVSTTGPSPTGTATISGTTNYNNTFTVSNVVPGVSFDINTAFVADDATGIYTIQWMCSITTSETTY